MNLNVVSAVNPQIDLIISTYQRPDALRLVLLALAAQDSGDFQVFIADDGSDENTADMLQSLAAQLPYPLQHVWQEDQGFRAAAARNRALARGNAEYVVFLDGDCMPPRNFVSAHRRLAETSCFVAGNRVLCGESFTRRVLAQGIPLWTWNKGRWLKAARAGDINRFTPLISLPAWFPRKYKRDRWEGAKTCNLAVWRKDLENINGFDEAYQGWGHEDADLVARLLRSGVERKEGRFAAAVFHLWHPENDRTLEARNQARLRELLDSTQIRAGQGLSQYF